MSVTTTDSISEAPSSPLTFYPFQCTSCHQGHCELNHQYNAVVCSLCKTAFPVKKGIVDFVPDWEDERTLAQSAMEWSPVVRIYESRLWRRNPLFEKLNSISFEDEASAIIKAARLKGHERVLDLACGTGNYSRRFAQAVPSGQVIGLDLSRPMLEMAVQNASKIGLDNVQFVRGNALELALPDASMDVVNCCGALHLFPDTNAALSEICRVLKPGGRFTTAVFRHRAGWIAKWLETMTESFLGVKTFSPKKLQTLIMDAGFEHSNLWHDKGGWLIVDGIK